MNQKETFPDILLSDKISNVTLLLAQWLSIPVVKAFDIFYKSKTSRELHDLSTDLYTFGDRYIANNVMNELRFPSTDLSR